MPSSYTQNNSGSRRQVAAAVSGRDLSSASSSAVFPYSLFPEARLQRSSCSATVEKRVGGWWCWRREVGAAESHSLRSECICLPRCGTNRPSSSSEKSTSRLQLPRSLAGVDSGGCSSRSSTVSEMWFLVIGADQPTSKGREKKGNEGEGANERQGWRVERHTDGRTDAR